MKAGIKVKAACYKEGGELAPTPTMPPANVLTETMIPEKGPQKTE
jgi:hypothetical protein